MSVRGIGVRASRSAILRAAHSRRVERFVGRYGMRLGARRFVPAETLDELVPVFRELTGRGIRGVTGLFDDYATAPADVERHEAEYARQVDRLADEGLDANVGIKLTHLGVYLDDPAVMDAAVTRLLERAAGRGMKLRIDMEESALVDRTLALYRRLRHAGHDNVGVVLQAYLRRSAADLEALLPLGLDVRIVKGAYLEPAAVAFQERAEVDASYRQLAERALAEARFTAIATHDRALIADLRGTIRRLDVAPARTEWQMLYGIATDLQERVRAAGEPLRVAAPYGPTWFPYLMRRLAERPANLAFFLRNAVPRPGRRP